MRPTSAARIGVVVLLGILALGCGSGEPEPKPVVLDTERLSDKVIRNAEQGIWLAGDEWRIREDLRIGKVAGDAAELFGSVRDLEVDASGNIYVLDSQAREIRVFDAEGRHIGTFGQPGSGPGGLRNPTTLGWTPEGKLLVIDPGGRRNTIFEPTGTVVSTQPRTYVPMDPAPGKAAFDEDGCFYDNARLYPAPGADPLDRREVILRFDVDMVPADTLPLPEFDPPTWRYASADGRVRGSLPIPFAPRLIWLFDNDARLWYAITDEYRIVQQTPDGRLLRVVEREVEPVAVTPREKAEALARLRQYAERSDAARNAPIDPADIPGAKPVLDRFFFDDTGHLWVNSTTAAARTRALAAEPEVRDVFDVFDPEGRYLGPVANEMPGRVFRIRGGMVYAVTLDGLGVHYVVRGKIVGR